MQRSPTGGARNASALVVGGSLAGLLAARVLADHCHDVTVIERDDLPDQPGPRRGAPQARHQHALLKRGRLIVEELFPGLWDELIGAGAPIVDMAHDFAWLTPAGWAVRFPSEFLMLTCSRDLLEWSIRRRLASHPRVRFRTACVVTGLVPRGDRSGVSGVTMRTPSGEEQLGGDLVVDASGRASRAPQWLESLGYEQPRETVITSHLGYASRIYRLTPGMPADCSGVYVQPAPPAFVRGGVILPLEGGRWHLTLAGGSGDYPPTDPDQFAEFARSLRSRRLYDIIESAEPLSPVFGFRATENRWRQYEHMRRWPNGLVILGDAACSFNPVYAQGMTTAALAAVTLARTLRELRPGEDIGRVGRRFQRALSKVCAPAWMLATGEDYRYEGVEGGSPSVFTRLMHRYMDRVVRLTTEEAHVRRVLLEVFHMLRPPTALFDPRLVRRVLRARRIDIRPTSGERAVPHGPTDLTPLSTRPCTSPDG